MEEKAENNTNDNMVELIINKRSNNVVREPKILRCPECKIHIPFISFIMIDNAIRINIKCSKCNQVSIMQIEQYKAFLLQEEETMNRKCQKHFNIISTYYCCNCHQWLCQSCLKTHKTFAQTHIITESEIDISLKETNKDQKEIRHSSGTNIPRSNCLTYSQYCNKDIFAEIKNIKTQEVKDQLNELLKENKKITQHIISLIDEEIQLLNQHKIEMKDLYEKNDEVNKQISFILECALFNYYLFEDHSTEEILLNVLDNINIQTIPDLSNCDLEKKRCLWINHMMKDYIIKIKDFSPSKIEMTKYNDIRCLIALEDGKYALGLNKGTIMLHSPEKETPLEKHKGAVLSLLQLKNTNLCSGSRDTTINIWDVDKPVPVLLSTFEGHTDSIYTIIEFGKESIVSGSNDYSICIWNILNIRTENKSNKQSVSSNTLSYKLVKKFKAHTDCVRVLLDLNDGRVVSGSWDKTIIVWDLNWEKKETLEGHSSYVNCLAQLSNSQLASGSFDKSIIIWDLLHYTSIGKIKVVEGVYSLFFLNDNGILIAGGYKDVTLLNISKLSKISTINNQHLSTINTVTRGKSKEVVTCCLKGMIKLWNI